MFNKHDRVKHIFKGWKGTVGYITSDRMTVNWDEEFWPQIDEEKATHSGLYPRQNAMALELDAPDLIKRTAPRPFVPQEHVKPAPINPLPMEAPTPEAA